MERQVPANQRFVIEGRHPLRGEIRPVGNKNAALPILAAALLTSERVVLHNVPRIEDVLAMLQLLEDLGVLAELTGQKKNRVYSYQAYVDLLSR